MTEIQALGWALVHSLWQAGLAAAALASLLTIVPPRAARTRYALAVLTLLLMVAVPAATAVRLRDESSWTEDRASAPSAVVPARPPAPVPGSISAANGAIRGERTPARPAPPVAARVRAALEPALPWLVVLWLGGVVVLSLRLASGWLGARRLGTEGTRPAPEACREALVRLAARLRVTRPVRVLESAVVQVPAVIGWLRPVILVPASALTGLTPLQLDALLAHELAHVRRYDYLVNLVQSVIETLMFYHPAVWWVSRRVREERENCCDDLAVAVCGDAHFYATALLGMERLRVTPAFALAASGGSLMGRIRRLVTPTTTEIFPRWIAGLIAVSVALAVGSGAGLAGASAAPDRWTERPSAGVGDPARAAPDTVVRHPDPARPLAERWDWASARARGLGGRAFWIGYSVQRSSTIEHAVSADRESEAFRGVRLAQLLGDREDGDAIAVLFRLTPGSGGGPTLARVHVSSFLLPVDFGGEPLLWLGPGEDGASLARLQALFAGARGGAVEIKEDLVAAVGLHGSHEVVVPVLARWLAGDEAASVRSEAAEWLGYHPTAAAVRALTMAARGDPSSEVREQAAEGLGDNALPAATDSLIALARSLEDEHARREAVEGLGQKRDRRMLATLIAVARHDPDEEVQREAVETMADLSDPATRSTLLDIVRTHPDGAVRREAIETLGRMKDDTSMRAVIDIARTHPDPDVRHEAVETIGKRAAPGVALEVLEEIVRGDRESDVQQTAVETLGKLHDRRAYSVLANVARHHPVSGVRHEAVKALGELGGSDSTVDLLASLVLEGTDTDVQKEAVETLGRLHDARALAAIARLLRTHPSEIVRRKAVEAYADVAAPETTLVVLRETLANDRSPDVQSEALDRLVDLPDGLGIPVVIEAARTHPNRGLRGEAWRRLDESDDPRARELVQRALVQP